MQVSFSGDRSAVALRGYGGGVNSESRMVQAIE